MVASCYLNRVDVSLPHKELLNSEELGEPCSLVHCPQCHRFICVQTLTKLCPTCISVCMYSSSDLCVGGGGGGGGLALYVLFDCLLQFILYSWHSRPSPYQDH